MRKILIFIFLTFSIFLSTSLYTFSEESNANIGNWKYPVEYLGALGGGLAAGALLTPVLFATGLDYDSSVDGPFLEKGDVGMFIFFITFPVAFTAGTVAGTYLVGKNFDDGSVPDSAVLATLGFFLFYLEPIFLRTTESNTAYLSLYIASTLLTPALSTLGFNLEIKDTKVHVQPTFQMDEEKKKYLGLAFNF